MAFVRGLTVHLDKGLMSIICSEKYYYNDDNDDNNNNNNNKQTFLSIYLYNTYTFYLVEYGQ